MTEKAMAIIFLSLFIIVPLGVLGALVYALIRKIRTQMGFRNLAKEDGRSYFSRTRSKSDLEYALSLVEPTLFAMRKGSHRILQGVRGNIRNSEFLAFEYHYRSPGTSSGTRRAGHYTVFAVKLTSGLPDLFIMHRKKGLLSTAAEKLAVSSLGVPENRHWEWALVSRDVDIPSLGLKGKSVKELIRPGESLFVFHDLIAMAKPGPANPRRAEEMILNSEKIERIFKALNPSGTE